MFSINLRFFLQPVFVVYKSSTNTESLSELLCIILALFSDQMVLLSCFQYSYACSSLHTGEDKCTIALISRSPLSTTKYKMSIRGLKGIGKLATGFVLYNADYGRSPLLRQSILFLFHQVLYFCSSRNLWSITASESSTVR